MADIPGGWITIVTLLVTTLASAIAYIWKSRETIFSEQIARLEAECAAGRLKVNELQDKLLFAAVTQAEAAKLQGETYARLARSLEEQNAALKAVAARVAP